MTDAAYAPGSAARAPWEDMPTEPLVVPSRAVQPSVTVNPQTGRTQVNVYRQPVAPWEDMPTEPPPPQEPARQIGEGEAAWTGVKSGMTFGFEPEVQGMSEAGIEALKRFAPEHLHMLQAGTEALKRFVPAEYLRHLASPVTAAIGGAVRLGEWASNHDDPELAAAVERGRKFAQETVDLSKEQHPLHFYGGMVLGSLALPGFGPELAGTRLAATALRGAAGPGTAVVRAAGAPLAERVASGVAQGGIYGGLQSTGEAVSRGESLPEVAKSAGKGVTFGAATGGALHGAVGPREAPMVPTPGQRAAATAEDLVGRPILPRGYASDRPIIRSATAKFESAPIAGPVIRGKVEEISGGAHGRVKSISEQMTGGVGERAGSDPVVRSGLEHVLNTNEAAKDAAYDKVRSFLPKGGGGPTASVHQMPRTKAVLDKIAAERKEAGEDPKAGLEAFHNIANGTTFNGAQRARSQARKPNLATKTNIGYSGGDYKRIMGAMGGDLRQMVVEGARGNAKDPRAALRAFEEADAKFGTLADQNSKIEDLLASGGESVLAQLIAKGSEKSGDLKTLRELKQAMPPDTFAHIGGTILRELGMQSTAAGRQFSPRTFANGWDNMSKGAKGALFDPAHRQNIDEIVHMVGHIGAGMKDVNVSKTAGAFWGVEMVSKVGEVAIAAMGGLITPMTALKSTATLFVPDALGFILASPAKTASARSWLVSYRAMINSPTPTRTAVFKIATRNLAHTIGVPEQAVTKAVQDQTPPQQPQSAQAEIPRR